VAEEQEPQKTPHTALIEALERVEEMEGVLVIFERKPDRGDKVMGSVDSDLTVAETIYYLDVYKAWLLKTYLKES